MLKMGAKNIATFYYLFLFFSHVQIIRNDTRSTTKFYLEE